MGKFENSRCARPFAGSDRTSKMEEGTPSPEELKAKYGRDIFRDFDFDAPVFNHRYLEVQEAILNYCPVAQIRRRLLGYQQKRRCPQGGHPNRPEGLSYFMPEDAISQESYSVAARLGAINSPDAPSSANRARTILLAHGYM